MTDIFHSDRLSTVTMAGRPDVDLPFPTPSTDAQRDRRPGRIQLSLSPPTAGEAAPTSPDLEIPSEGLGDIQVKMASLDRKRQRSERSPNRSPNRSLNRSLNRSPNRSLNRSLNRSPNRSLGRERLDFDSGHDASPRRNIPRYRDLSPSPVRRSSRRHEERLSPDDTDNIAMKLFKLQTSSRRSYIAKLAPYDGVTEPLETFLARFENYSSQHRWDEEECLFNLRNLLDKNVGNILWDSGSSSSSADLIALLRSRYGFENQTERFWIEDAKTLIR